MAGWDARRSGNPAVRAQARAQPPREGRIAIIISSAALLVSLFAALGTWAQVLVDREAISEKLNIRADVRLYDIDAGEYEPVLEENQRAPNPVQDTSRLYLIVHVGNIGKGSGLIAEIGIRMGDTATLTFPSPSCENRDDPGGDTETCPLPMTLATAQSAKIYLSITEERLAALGCSGPDATIEVYVIDSTGQQTTFDTGVLRPDSIPACAVDDSGG